MYKLWVWWSAGSDWLTAGDFRTLREAKQVANDLAEGGTAALVTRGPDRTRPENRLYRNAIGQDSPPLLVGGSVG